MLRKILSFITATTLAFSIFAFSPKTTTVTAESNDFDCTYSAGAQDLITNLRYFGSSEIITYTEEEAVSAGIPAGFSGDVLKVVGLHGSTDQGALLDFSHLNIPSFTVESITFRVYVSSDSNTSDGYPEVRIPKPYKPNEWTFRYYDIKNHIAEWHDVVFTGDLSPLCEDGILAKFEFGLRHKNVSDFYIDSIKINYIEDNDAPVINYNGKDHLIITEGQPLNLNVSATDAVQGDVDVEMIWADPSKIDEQGNPMLGEHTLTLRSTDYFGNVAERTITITVTTPDTTAPTFSVPTENIYVKIGTTPLISVKATDDRDDVTPTYTWSEGALDKKGRLTEGVHTLTISASDLSGNTTTKTITFTVTENGDSSDNVIDEDELCKEEESESESETESEIESEVESESQSEIESETESQTESETASELESEIESESQSEIESETESEIESESKEATSSVESNSIDSEEISSSESLESGEATTSFSCTGSISALPFVSLITLAGIVVFIRKRK